MCIFNAHAENNSIFRDGLGAGHYHAGMRIWHSDRKCYENAKSLLYNGEKAKNNCQELLRIKHKAENIMPAFQLPAQENKKEKKKQRWPD